MKTAVIILDMARGYGDASTYEPGMVSRIKRLKDVSHERGAPVLHVHSLRRPTDNTVLWTAADAFQNRYAVCVVEDCTMVHRRGEPSEVKEYALRIVRNVLHSDVLPLEDALAKYLAEC